MFVVDQTRKIIFDMRHYGIYTMDKVLLAYPSRVGLANSITIAEFDSQSTCEKIAQEIRIALARGKQTGEIFLYRVPTMENKTTGGKNCESKL